MTIDTLFVTNTFVDGLTLGLEDLLAVLGVSGRSFIERWRLEAIEGSTAWWEESVAE